MKAIKFTPQATAVVFLVLGSVVTQVYAADCSQPQVRTIDPVLKWEWTGSDVLPEYNQVMTTPLVAPLEDTNGDGRINELDTPAVIFNTFTGYHYNKDGVLRAIRGSDGSELWTITDPEHRIFAGRTFVVADIDGDGVVEIIAFGDPTNQLLAFEHTGKLKWKKTINIGSTLPVAANINDNTAPELFFYHHIIDGNGTVLNSLTDNLWGLPIVADINLDTQPEVLIGGGAFSKSGGKLWQLVVNGVKTSATFSAVGNFDADDFPEIVLTQYAIGKVYLVSHTGEVIWQRELSAVSQTAPDGQGGAPVLADMDSDGELEIGIAGGSKYVVYNADGSILWTADIQDFSSAATGSSAFDFDGDGKVEIVYNDEKYLRIFAGDSGDVLFQTPNTTGTLVELPVIVDVDNDYHADIVVAANNYGGRTWGQTGIRVFQDRNNSWMNARKIWNQHAYHISNINDDGTVPANPEPSWLTHNTFRAQLPLPDAVCEAARLSCLLTDDPAVYDPDTRITSIPAVDMPTLNPLTGLPEQFSVFALSLLKEPGVNDFRILDDSLVYLGSLPTFDPAHARYTYNKGPLFTGGKLDVCVSVPSVVVVPPGIQVPGPVHDYAVTLRQLAVEPDILHIERMEQVNR